MSDMAERLNAALEGRYAIESELGEGASASNEQLLRFDPDYARRGEAEAPPPPKTVYVVVYVSIH